MFDSVSAERVHRGTLSNYQCVTDVCKNCSERSGCSLSWLVVYCKLLISHTAPANALFNIHLGKFDDSHISIWLSAAYAPPPPPTPCSNSPAVAACSLCAAGGLRGRTQSSASRHPLPPGPGGGEGQIKACLAPSSSSCTHLKSTSQQGCVVPSLRLP